MSCAVINSVNSFFSRYELLARKKVRGGTYPQDKVVGVERSLAIPEHPSLCSCLGVSIQGLKTWRSSLVS